MHEQWRFAVMTLLSPAFCWDLTCLVTAVPAAPDAWLQGTLDNIYLCKPCGQAALSSLGKSPNPESWSARQERTIGFHLAQTVELQPLVPYWKLVSVMGWMNQAYKPDWKILEESAAGVFTWAFCLGLGLRFWSHPPDWLQCFDLVYTEAENCIPSG